jgi:hypothetical protein
MYLRRVSEKIVVGYVGPAVICPIKRTVRGIQNAN